MKNIIFGIIVLFSALSFAKQPTKAQCELAIAAIEEGLNSGEDDQKLLGDSQKALILCSSAEGSSPKLKEFIALGSKVCKQAADQVSALHTAMCNQRVGKVAVMVLN